MWVRTWENKTRKCCFGSPGKRGQQSQIRKKVSEMTIGSDSDGHLSANCCPKDCEQRAGIFQKCDFFRRHVAKRHRV